MTASELNKIMAADVSWLNAPWKFVSIDIEGIDTEFVNDLDLDSLKPDVIAIESFLPEDVSDWDKISYLSNASVLVRNLQNGGYNLQSVCGPTLIFVRIESKKK